MVRRPRLPLPLIEDERFGLLNKALAKGELVVNIMYSETFLDRKEEERIKIYRFENGVTIAQEEEFEEGPLPSSEPLYHHRKSTFYFVFKDGRPVTNEEEAINLIYQATGIKLPESSAGVKFGNYYEIVTNFDISGEGEYLASLDTQPDEEDIAVDLRNVLGFMGSLREGFGLDIDDLSTHLKSIEELAYELYQKYKNYDPLYKYIFDT